MFFPQKFTPLKKLYAKILSSEGENAIDNSVDNTSSSTLVIVDPLSDIDKSVLHSNVVLSVFLNGISLN